MTLSLLAAKHPALFASSLPCSHVPPGWLPLVTDLVEILAERFPEIRIAQIKEKFGTLRFYVGAAPREALDLIGFAEAASGDICQRCGKVGAKLHRNARGWVKTICGGCLN